MNEAADPEEKVPYNDLWLNPTKTLTDLGFRGAVLPKTPPEYLAEGMPPSVLQHRLYFSTWTCNTIGSGPDPKPYGERSYANMLQQDFGPVVFRVQEPSWTLKDGKVIAVGAMPFDFFSTEILITQLQELDQSGRVIYPLQEDILGQRELHYYIDTDTWHTYLKAMADGPAPVPEGYPYPDAYPKVMKGPNRAMHVLMQMEETFYGMFDIYPTQARASGVATGMAYYSPYFPVVLPEFAKLRQAVNAKGAKLGLNMDIWNNGCATTDLPGLVTTDPYPSPSVVAIEAFENGLQLNPALAVQALAKWMKDWYNRHPEWKTYVEHKWFASTRAWPFMLANGIKESDLP
jgi:hypothetical protein